MPGMRTIDDVIIRLGDIIAEAGGNNNPRGYFAALYRKVTIKVKEGVESGFFENGMRMEKLDVLFAARYIDAYTASENNEQVTRSWKKAFDYSARYWPIVMQHLLVGMNAHINLDLGIAAAEVTKNTNIADLQNDFNKINEILSSLVNEVQSDLISVWPPLKWILKLTGKVDDLIVDFSMSLARDGAWEFAKSLAAQPAERVAMLIESRDNKIAEKAKIITNPGWFASTILAIIRLGERGSVKAKIKSLM